MVPTVLIVDDDPDVLESLTEALSGSARNVQVAHDASAALASFARAPVDIVLTDIRMPGMDGLDLLRTLKSRVPDVTVVVMTAFDDLPTVSEAMREGAADFLVKPLDLHRLRGVMRRVSEDRAAQARARRDDRSARSAESATSFSMIGHDPSMIEIFKVIGQVADTRTNVVIRGESGTGKELVARAIHRASPYGSEPFVPVNCTALPANLLESELFGHVKGSFTGASANRQGRFALAGRGTIFLDEIGDTSVDFQAKLLRVLQEHEYYPVGAERPETAEARVIAATHRDLETLVAEGCFREDLYYRLRVVEICIPPLRDRLADIPLLAEHLVAKAAESVGRPTPVVPPDAVQALTEHTWPGNVRELENCLTRAVVLATGGVLRPEHLAFGPHRQDARHRLATIDEVEKDHVSYVLETTGGNRSRAARILGVSRPRLRRMIERHGLAGDDDSDPESSD